MPKITIELLEAGKSMNNFWSERQLAILGLDFKNKGWKKRAIGKEITQEQVDKFLLLKDAHLKNKQKFKHLFQEKLF